MLPAYRSNRASQNVLSKALFAGKVGHLVKNSNVAEGVLAGSRRASRQWLFRVVARSRGMPNTASSSCLAEEPLAIRCSNDLQITLH